jgi:urease subunit gamma/beta
LISDEVMTAARRDLPYDEIRDMAHGILTTDDLEPGVAEMTQMIYIECLFAEGTKMMALFAPIGPGKKPVSAGPVPGEVIVPEGEVEVLAGLDRIEVAVINTGDRDIQVRSHSHFFETNRALDFDRPATWGHKLDVPAGMGVRFEPGVRKTVRLVPIEGARRVIGAGGLVMGALDALGVKEAALAIARERGYRGV